MEERLEEPATRPLSPAELRLKPELRLRHLLIDARPTKQQRSEDRKGSEQTRVAAVREMLALYREYVSKADETEPPPLEPRTRLRAAPRELLEFLQTEGLRIWAQPDPKAALRKFLGQQRRGRPGPALETRAKIASRMDELIDKGMTAKEAKEQAAAEFCIKAKTADKIFYEFQGTTKKITEGRASDREREEHEEKVLRKLLVSKRLCDLLNL
jgi:hypothetical protein